MPLVTTDTLWDPKYLNFSKGAIINVMGRESYDAKDRLMWEGELEGVWGQFLPEYVKEVHGEFPVQTSQLVPWPRALQIRRYTPRH